MEIRVIFSGKKYARILKIMMPRFSSSEPILFGGFVCAKIPVLRDSAFHDLLSDLPIDVSVINVSDQKNKRNLSHLKSSLPWKSEKGILLPNPIHIRTGPSYEIHLIQSPEGHCSSANEVKSEVRLKSDEIQFYDDLVIVGHYESGNGIIIQQILKDAHYHQKLNYFVSFNKFQEFSSQFVLI